MYITHHFGLGTKDRFSSMENYLLKLCRILDLAIMVETVCLFKASMNITRSIHGIYLFLQLFLEISLCSFQNL